MATKRKCSRNVRQQGLATLRSSSTKAHEGSCSQSCQIPTVLQSPRPVADSQMSRNPKEQTCSPSTDSAYVSVLLDSSFGNATSNSNTTNFQHSEPSLDSQSNNRCHVMRGHGHHRQASETSTLSSETGVNQVSQHYIPSRETRFRHEDWEDRKSFMDSKLNSNEDVRKPKELNRESPRMFLMRPRAKHSFPQRFQENLFRRRTLSESNPSMHSRQRYPVYNISQLRGQSLRSFQRSRKSSPDESSQIYYLGDGFDNHESNGQYPDYAFGSPSQFKSYSHTNVCPYQLQKYPSYQKRSQNEESGAIYFSGRYPHGPFSFHELDPEVNRTYDILEPNQNRRYDTETRSHEIRLLNRHEGEKKKKMSDNHEKQLQNELEPNHRMSKPGENEEIDRKTQSRPSRRTQRYPKKQQSNYGQQDVQNTRSGDLTTLYQNEGVGVCKKNESCQEVVSPRKNCKAERPVILTEGNNRKRVETSTSSQHRASNSYRWLPGPGTSCDRFRGGSPHPDIKRGQWDKHLPPKGHNNKHPREHLQKSISHTRKDWFAAWGLSEHEMMQANMGDSVDDLKTALSRSCPHTFAPWNTFPVKVKKSDSETIHEDAPSSWESQAEDRIYLKLKTEADSHGFINQYGAASSRQMSRKKDTCIYISKGANESSVTSSHCSTFSLSANDEDKTSISSEWDSQQNKKNKKQKQRRKKNDRQNGKNVNSANKVEDKFTSNSEKSSVSKQVLQKQGGELDSKKWYRPEEEEPKNEQKHFINLQQHRERQKQWQKKILQRHKQLQKKRERQQRKQEQEQQKAGIAAKPCQETRNKDTPHTAVTKPRTTGSALSSITRSSLTEMADSNLSTFEETLASKKVTSQAEQGDSISSQQNQSVQLSIAKKLSKRSLSLPEGFFDSTVLRKIKFLCPGRIQKTLKRLKKHNSPLTLQTAHKEISGQKKELCKLQLAEKKGNVEIIPPWGFSKMLQAIKSKEALDKVVRRTLSKNFKLQPSRSTKYRKKITVGDWQWRFFVGTSGMTFVMCIAVAYFVAKIT